MIRSVHALLVPAPRTHKNPHAPTITTLVASPAPLELRQTQVSQSGPSRCANKRLTLLVRKGRGRIAARRRGVPSHSLRDGTPPKLDDLHAHNDAEATPHAAHSGESTDERREAEGGQHDTAGWEEARTNGG